MCGRYVSPESASIERQWRLAHGAQPFPVRYNVAPGTEVPLLLFSGNSFSLRTARWGLIPGWWKERKPPRLSHNARAEEAATKPLWRDAMRGARALMPALGWYEWREGDRQPFYFFRRDGRLASFAALFSVFEDRLTCALLTMQARERLAAVHDRMPIALADEEAEGAWLRAGELAATPGRFDFYPVCRLVNTASSEGPALIEAMPT